MLHSTPHREDGYSDLYSPWRESETGTKPVEWRPPDPHAAASALRALGPVVYAIRIGDCIKIGFSENLANRRKNLSSATNDLLAFRPGTLAEEQAIHAELVGHRHHAWEYYHPTPAVLAVVNEMRETIGLEPIAA